MMEDDFYGTIKLKSGEEIFAKVSAMDERDRLLLLVSNPIVVEEIKMRGKINGYKFEPWLKTTQDDMFILNMEDVLTMTENSDIQMIVYYQDFVKRLRKNNHTNLDRKMGYLGGVSDTKDSLEKLFNKS